MRHHHDDNPRAGLFISCQIWFWTIPSHCGVVFHFLCILCSVLCVLSVRMETRRKQQQAKMKTSVGTERKRGAICTSFFGFYYFTTTTTTRSTRKKRRRRWRRSYYGKSTKCQDTGAEESVRFRGRRKGRRTAKRMKTDAQCNDKQFVTESASQVSFFLLLVVGSQGRSVVADPTKSQAKNKSSVCANWWHPSSYFFYYRFQNKSNVLVSFFLLYYRIKKRVIEENQFKGKSRNGEPKRKKTIIENRKENTDYEFKS